MAKKAGGQEPSKKTEQKAKAKIIEDKTFGLKNKNKSAKVSKYVEQVTQQVQQGGSRKAQKEEEAKALLKKQKKEEEERLKKEEALLGKPVIVQPKIPFGADPKSFLCQAFKAGQCTKGDKCKYAHDLGIERKSAKIDLFSDVRDDQENDTIEKWDQDKLETVVQRKHGAGVRTTTDIVCKHFLDAIENRKYGWFWECPSGGDTCKYRHALPPGYVFKQRAPALGDDDPDDDEHAISLEEFLDGERRSLAGDLTPVTAETFAAWKAARIEKLRNEGALKDKKKQDDVRTGKALATGRELFATNAELFSHMDDDEAMDDDVLKHRQQDYYIDVDGITVAPDTIDEDLFLAEELDDLDVSS